eukprot:308201-Amphidinium_carterae.1
MSAGCRMHKNPTTEDNDRNQEEHPKTNKLSCVLLWVAVNIDTIGQAPKLSIACKAGPLGSLLAMIRTTKKGSKVRKSGDLVGTIFLELRSKAIGAQTSHYLQGQATMHYGSLDSCSFRRPLH